MLDYRQDQAAAAQERATARDVLARRLGYDSFTGYLLQRHRQASASMTEMRLETGLDLSSLREGIAQSLLDVPFLAPPPAPKLVRPVEQPPKQRRRPARRPLPPRVAPPATYAPPSPSDVYLSASEVAAGLGLSRNTVLRLVKGGQLPAWKTPGKHLRVSPADAVAFAAGMGLPVESLPAAWLSGGA